MNIVNPMEVLREVSASVPVDCRENIVIIGSLAAAYAYFGDNEQMAVRTKDVDCMLKPYREAVEKGEAITRRLLDDGWQPGRTGDHHVPGSEKTPDNELPAIRLYRLRLILKRDALVH